MKFQWLKDYQELEEQINYLKWSLNKSELELIRWVDGDLVDVKLEKQSRASHLEKNIDEVKTEIKRLEQNKQEVIQLVDTFEGVDSKIIKFKYIYGMTLDDIADEIGYSLSYVRKKHTEIKKIMKHLAKNDASK